MRKRTIGIVRGGGHGLHLGAKVREADFLASKSAFESMVWDWIRYV